MCGQRNIDTLDYYLPKKKNPSFAVTPVNLVPACSDCNKDKSSYHPTNMSERFIHPYFDEMPSSVWLIADVIEGEPPSLQFKISTPLPWNGAIVNRLIWHFEKLKLAKLYTSQSGRMLAGKLEAAVQRGGETEVKFSLSEDVDSWSRVNPNCWQTAMFRALHASDWFCTEEYALIRNER